MKKVQFSDRIAIEPDNPVISIEMGDITKSDCEAIVNAANKSLLGGGGVDGAIHAAAGKKLLEECRTLGGCQTGQAKLTKGYDLKAKYVIHTVGPVYTGKASDEVMLRSCYLSSLDLAKENNIHTIAFPAISTGVYGYPVEKAVPIAAKAVLEWIEKNRDYDMRVTFVCFNEKIYDLFKKIFVRR